MKQFENLNGISKTIFVTSKEALWFLVAIVLLGPLPVLLASCSLVRSQSASERAA
jgi:hypothetical protein